MLPVDAVERGSGCLLEPPRPQKSLSSVYLGGRLLLREPPLPPLLLIWQTHIRASTQLAVEIGFTKGRLTSYDTGFGNLNKSSMEGWGDGKQPESFSHNEQLRHQKHYHIFFYGLDSDFGEVGSKILKATLHTRR